MSLGTLKEARSLSDWQSAKENIFRGQFDKAAQTLVNGKFYARDVAQIWETDYRSGYTIPTITELLLLVERMTSLRNSKL